MQIWLVFSGLLLGLLLGALDQTIVATALPTIVSDLGGFNELSWVVTAYLLASTASTPLWGKIGDLFGRKRVFQAAILLFLIGSAASGLSQNMGELIGFRALQGLGGGGLIVTAMAIVGDIVSARDRGRYQGIFGAVFAVASIVGPLLGGYIVQNFSWHWVFYINVPIGLIALAVTGTVLPNLQSRAHPIIDYLGTVLIAGAATAMVLIASLGGVTYAWGSTFILSLGVAAIVLTILFILVERRSKEPVLPLRLFRNPIFSMTSAIGFIVGFAMFGAITFLPLYLQVVQRVSPTDSGLRLLPMLAGMLLTSITSGQLISRWGRYKAFPIAGTLVMGAGLYLLSLLDLNTSTLAMSGYMFVMGLGLGMVMQVLVIAVQNAVEFRDLGTATSGSTFFRSIGGAFGVAIFGEIFAHALNTNLAKILSTGSLPAGFNPQAAMSNPQLLQSLPLSVIGSYLQAFAQSLHTVFLFAIPFAAVGFVLSWFLKEAPLRLTVNPGNIEGATPAVTQLEANLNPVVERETGLEKELISPAPVNPIEAIEQAVSQIASHEKRLTLYENIAAWAQIPLDPWSTSLLIQVGRNEPVSLEELGQKLKVTPASMELALDTLSRNGLVAIERDGNVHHDPIRMTTDGRLTYDRLVEGRQRGLGQIFADWSPEQNAALAEMLNRLAITLANDGHDLQMTLKTQSQSDS